MNRITRFRFALALVLLGVCGTAYAWVAVSSPASGAIWNANSNQSVKFSYSRGCVHAKVEIYREGQQVAPLWFSEVGAQSANPVTIQVNPVPWPQQSQPGTLTDMTCKVTVTHMDQGKSTEEIPFQIRN
jgi:hypothetical protein